jgi:hypothetical protein
LPADGFFSALQKRRGKRIGIPGEQTVVGAHGNETIAPILYSAAHPLQPRSGFLPRCRRWPPALHINYPKYIIDMKIYYNSIF